MQRKAMLCPAGQIFNDFCRTCPQGSFASGKECLLSPIGHYTPHAGLIDYYTCKSSKQLGCAFCEPEISKVTTIAGRMNNSSSIDGVGTSATFFRPSGIALDSSGYVYVSENIGRKIRKISPSRDVTTFVGSGMHGCADGIGKDITFQTPSDIAIDTDGNVFVADFEANTIRKVTSAGISSTIAGWERYTRTIAGQQVYRGYNDGLGTLAEFYLPSGIEVDRYGNCYVAEPGFHIIRKIDSGGFVSTIAGRASLGAGYFTDGIGTIATMRAPHGLAVDSIGNLYVADRDRIRKIALDTFDVTSFAGSNNYPDESTPPSNEDGEKSTIFFHFATDVAIDASLTIYVSEYGGRRIRRISSSGYVTTVAGSGKDESADGLGTLASFKSINSIALDAAKGELYLTDTNSETVRMIALWPGYRCRPGEYFNGERCAAVPAGYYNPGDSSGSYYACPVGTFSAMPGASLSCTRCPPGYTTVVPAQTACSELHNAFVVEDL